MSLCSFSSIKDPSSLCFCENVWLWAWGMGEKRVRLAFSYTYFNKSPSFHSCLCNFCFLGVWNLFCIYQTIGSFATPPSQYPVKVVAFSMVPLLKSLHLFYFIQFPPFDECFLMPTVLGTLFWLIE